MLQKIIRYQVQNKVHAPDLCDTRLDGEIGARFDRFVYERISGGFAIREILHEAEACFADQYDDEFCCGKWRGEFWGKLILSAVRTADQKQDEALKRDIRDSVYRMLGFQRADGYLSTYRDSDNIFPADLERARREAGWDCDYNWNIWGQKYTLWALIEAAQLLDDRYMLSCAARMADFLVEQIRRLGVRVKDTGVMHGMAACSIMKPMLLLYRLTGKTSYLDFCLDIAREWDREDNECPNLIRNACSNIPVSKWYEGWYAKAYEMMSCFDGLCELYRVTGNKRYFDAVSGLWELAYQHESNILGSVGYCERFYDAAGYADSATEICDVIHWMRLCHELFCLTGDARYMDAFERAFLNAFLAGIYEDGKTGAFFVRSAGRHWTAEPQVDTKYQHCCVNNAARGFINAAESSVMFDTAESGIRRIYINQYYPSRTCLPNQNGKKTTVRISSGYTDQGHITITLRGAEPGSLLRLRVPGWSRYLTVDGLYPAAERIKTEKPETYLDIQVTDNEMTFRVAFDMTPRIVDPVCRYCESGSFCELPPDDYHRQRWVDSSNGFCDRGAMLAHPMSVVYRGPLLLARSKRVGNTEAEMFSGETVYGQSCQAQASVIRHDRMLCACRIVVTTADEKREYVMCDYDSAANRDLEDARYFSVYI